MNKINMYIFILFITYLIKTKPEINISFNQYNSLSKEEEELLFSIDEDQVIRFIKNHENTNKKKLLPLGKKSEITLDFQIIKEDPALDSTCYLKISINNEVIISPEILYNAHPLLKHLSYGKRAPKNFLF